MFSIVVILYQDAKPQSLPIVPLLVRHPNDEFLFLDNSTDPTIVQRNQGFFTSIPNVRYFSNGGNAGLSAAYNRACKEAKEDWLILLDQDTQVPNEYFSCMAKSIEEHPEADGFVPTVKESGGSTISPLLLNGYSFSAFLGRVGTGECLVAVNSGSCLRKSAIQDVGGFDERYFLDFVDFSFYRAFAEKKHALLPVELTLIQQFSGTSRNPDKEAALRRFGHFCEDSSHFYGESAAGKKAYRHLIAKRRWHLFFQYWDVRFLKKIRR
jgi:rhamnosyltransferase